MVVEAGWFHEVDDSKAVQNASSHVCHSEIIPLGVPVRVEVSTKGQLILMFTPLRKNKQKYRQGSVNVSFTKHLLVQKF